MNSAVLKEATKERGSKEIIIKALNQGFDRSDITKYKLIFEEFWRMLPDETGTHNRLENSKHLVRFFKHSPAMRSVNRDVRNVYRFLIAQMDDSIEDFESAKRLGRKVIDERHFQYFKCWCIFGFVIHAASRK